MIMKFKSIINRNVMTNASASNPPIPIACVLIFQKKVIARAIETDIAVPKINNRRILGAFRLVNMYSEKQ